MKHKNAETKYITNQTTAKRQNIENAITIANAPDEMQNSISIQANTLRFM